MAFEVFELLRVPVCRLAPGTVFTWAALGGFARAEVAIWAAGNAVKIRPDAPRPAATYVWDGERVAIKGGRGERESFQVVISSDLARPVAFQIFDLEGLRGKVAAANVSVYGELYLPVNWPSVDLRTNFSTGLGRGRWPDPLVPLKGYVEAAAGENTVLWFDLHVPPKTAAGKYRGRIKFKWSGGEYDLPLELTVWDVDVPAAGRFEFVAGLDEADVCRLYGTEPDTERGKAILAKYYSLLKEHGVTSGAGPLDEKLEPFGVMTFAEGEAYQRRVETLKGDGVRVAYYADGLADYIDRPASDHRLLGWALWRFRGDLLRLEEVSYFPRKDAKPLSDDPRSERGNGARALAYPGAAAGLDEPLASIRLKLIREAAEDYEYLAMLADAGLAAYADELAAGVVPTLPRAGAQGPEPARFYDAREAAALALVKSKWGQVIAEDAVRGKVVDDDGAAVAGALVRAGPLASVAGSEGDYELRYVPRGRLLTAVAAGYEKGGASGAGGRADFFLKKFLRRFILNGDDSPERFSDKGFEKAGLAYNNNTVGGPALVGRLREGRTGGFEFRPALQDWRTLGVLTLELYNGSAEGVAATVRLEDRRGAFYEEEFLLTPGRWRLGRIDLGLARERFYLEAKGSGDGLKFKTKPKIDISKVNRVKVSFAGRGGGEVRLGRVWLEARGD